MTMTRSQAARPADPAKLTDLTEIDGAEASKVDSDKVDAGRAEPVAVGRRVRNAAVPHRNEIVVVGELTAPVEPRRRADGQEVLTFRVAVRSPGIGLGPDSAPSALRDVSGSGRRDILDCVVSAGAVRRRLETYNPGDVVELGGSLRHRFWNTAGRVQSRYEIEVGTLKRLSRARATRSPGAEQT